VLGVVGVTRLRVEGEGALQERLGRGPAAGGLVERRQLAERGGQPRVVGPVGPSAAATARRRSRSAAR
jgi:hypothetical protein